MREPIHVRDGGCLFSMTFDEQDIRELAAGIWPEGLRELAADFLVVMARHSWGTDELVGTNDAASQAAAQNGREGDAGAVKGGRAVRLRKSSRRTRTPAVSTMSDPNEPTAGSVSVSTT